MPVERDGGVGHTGNGPDRDRSRGLRATLLNTLQEMGAQRKIGFDKTVFYSVPTEGRSALVTLEGGLYTVNGVSFSTREFRGKPSELIAAIFRADLEHMGRRDGALYGPEPRTQTE